MLGLRWLGHVRHKRDEPEKTSREYGLWTLFHLFFVTCLPFSTMVVGQYGELAAAVWLYAANMAADGARRDEAFLSRRTRDRTAPGA